MRRTIRCPHGYSYIEHLSGSLKGRPGYLHFIDCSTDYQRKTSSFFKAFLFTSGRFALVNQILSSVPLYPGLVQKDGCNLSIKSGRLGRALELGVQPRRE